jgi:cation diffusion facilitator CzcD-associated flavoprotein CzcO
MQAAAGREPRIAIIGSGFSGLCLGIQLRRAGIHSFTIYEKAASLGGTWRDNTYPGAACDVPAMSYCFSFEQKSDWSRKFALQSEILEYMEHCAQKYGLTPHFRFGTEIERADFDEDAGCWRLRTRDGEEIEAEVLVSGVGQLNRPSVPEIAGLESFRGERFHSARWDHSVPLDGRRVGVIGNAASAVQFVPEVAKRAGRVSVFQRSANWTIPRMDRAYTEKEKQRFARFPWLAKLVRWSIYLTFEMQWPVFRRSRFMAKRYEQVAEKNLYEVIQDAQMRQTLRPTYPIGGKRILISDDYYQALTRENVELVTAGIERVEPDGVRTRDGRRVPLDVLILSTGFATTEFLAPIELSGLAGASLRDEWRQGARAYKGISLSGFPNFFMMYGPNTNLGHNSIIFMIECQTRYILGCIRALRERGLAWLDLRREVMEAWNDRLQEELARTVWNDTDHSWYKNAAGRITNNWSGSTLRYWWTTRSADLDAYHQVARRAAAAPAARERTLARPGLPAESRLS